MPEMIMRYQPGREEEALNMIQMAASVASEVFRMEVVWECREFGKTFGQPTFAVVTQVTDNDDALVDVALRVHEAVLDAMVQYVREGDTVEHWIQRVKGKWDQRRG